MENSTHRFEPSRRPGDADALPACVGSAPAAVSGAVAGVAIWQGLRVAGGWGTGWGLAAAAVVVVLLTGGYALAHRTMHSRWGICSRALLIGFNGGLSAGIWASLGAGGLVPAAGVAAIILPAGLPAVARRRGYKTLLGWSNWLSPMSWPVTLPGLVLWILNGLGHLFLWTIPSWFGKGLPLFQVQGFRMDWTTAMLATRGGGVSNANAWRTAFNMGNFAFVHAGSASWHLAHEGGHTLNLAAFGFVFHYAGFVHEVGKRTGSGAVAEQLAESNASDGTAAPQWG